MKEGVKGCQIGGLFWLPLITPPKNVWGWLVPLICLPLAGFARLLSCCHQADNSEIRGSDSGGMGGSVGEGSTSFPAMELFLEGYLAGEVCASLLTPLETEGWLARLLSSYPPPHPHASP